MPDTDLKQIQDFVAAFCGAIGSDVKDIREQLCGHDQRDRGEYAGWPQLGGHTVVDAIADIRQRLDTLEKR